MGPRPGAKKFRVRTKLVKVMECLSGCSWEAEVLRRFTPVTEALGVGELELLEKGSDWIAQELKSLGISEGPVGKTELWPRKLVEECAPHSSPLSLTFFLQVILVLGAGAGCCRDL